MPVSDEQLMMESSRDSIPAFELLIRRWEQRMLVFLYRCVGNRVEAEDLRQELFLRVYQKRSSFRPEGHFDAWLYRIATNLVIDKYARKAKLRTHSLEEMELGQEHTEADSPLESRKLDVRNQAALGEFEERIWAALQRIPDNERIVLILRHFENLNFKEIAEWLNEPESTVKSRVYRGLESMKQELKQAGIFETDCILST